MNAYVLRHISGELLGVVNVRYNKQFVCTFSFSIALDNTFNIRSIVDPHYTPILLILYHKHAIVHMQFVPLILPLHPLVRSVTTLQ